MKKLGYTTITGITSLSLVIIMLAVMLLSAIQITSTPRPVYATTQTQEFKTVGTSNFTPPTGVTSVTVLVVAGGGGGGYCSSSGYPGGGGGAGGVIYNTSYTVSPGANVSVTVGNYGTGATSGQAHGVNGSNSLFGTLTAIGGGGGGSGPEPANAGYGGGSGGGGGANTLSHHGTGGSGTAGQGKDGAAGYNSGGAGGGGGNTTTPSAPAGNPGGAGGTGSANYSSTFNYAITGGVGGKFAGGGGGGAGAIGAGGAATEGGGTGGSFGAGSAGTVNSGGGGGGGGGGMAQNGWNGGTGYVIVMWTTYTLTYTAGSHGSISGTSPQTVTSGASGTAVTANPDACYHFTTWSDTGLSTNPRTDTGVVADITATANFAINTTTLTTTVAPAGAITAGCTVTNNSSNPHNCGSVVQLTANTVAGWTFSSWSGGGLSGSTNPTTITMDADKSVTATFTPSNSAPTVTSVTLQQSDKATGTSAMTPQNTYYAEIVAGDADTIDDINQIDIWIFRDDNANDDGSPAGLWDADHEAIYRWAKSGSTWSMQNGSNTTTWGITTGSCDTPGNMAATSGEWNLYFTVGKLAQESDGAAAEWDIKVTVTDSVSNTAPSTIYSKSMGAYSSLSLSSATIGFSNIALGGTAAIQTPGAHYIILQPISNDAFALGSKSSSPWTNGGSNTNLDVDGSPASTYFSLTQDNAGDGSGHPTTPQYVTTSTVTITDLGAVSRTSTAVGANEATTDTNIYMDCILGASGLIFGTYSGAITFTITNS